MCELLSYEMILDFCYELYKLCWNWAINSIEEYWIVLKLLIVLGILNSVEIMNSIGIMNNVEIVDCAERKVGQWAQSCRGVQCTYDPTYRKQCLDNWNFVMYIKSGKWCA